MLTFAIPESERLLCDPNDNYFGANTNIFLLKKSTYKSFYGTVLSINFVDSPEIKTGKSVLVGIP